MRIDFHSPLSQRSCYTKKVDIPSIAADGNTLGNVKGKLFEPWSINHISASLITMNLIMSQKWSKVKPTFERGESLK